MSSKPVLWYAMRSPPARAVLLTAAAIGVKLDLKVPKLNDPEFVKLNPAKTVPVLNDNGTIVNDSHVINGYLVDTYSSDDSLYPKDPVKRRKVNTLLFFDACHLFSRSRLLVEDILKHGGVTIEQKNIEFLQESYDLLEQMIGDSPYLCGDHVTIADFHAVTSITSALTSAPLDDEKHPKVKSWIERMSQLPYYDEINGKGLQVLAKEIKALIELNTKAKGL